MTNPLYDALIKPHLNNSECFLLTDTGGEISYHEFIQRASQFAHVLTEAGVAPGDRIVVQAAKLVETLALYVASIQIGAVYLPLNTGYTISELEYFINDAKPSVIVCADETAGKLRTIASQFDCKTLTLNPNVTGSLIDSAENQPTRFLPVQRGSDDLAALLYTSGTTGRSKGAMLSQANLLSNARVLVNLWAISADDTLIHALPIFHTHGLFVAINSAMLAGARMRWLSSFDLEKILDALPRSTLMMGVPTFYTRLLGDPRFDRSLTSNMRLFISGSAPLLSETHEAFEARTGHRILERYGMTETNMNTSNPYEGERRAGTVGFPLQGTEIKITDPESGAELPVGDIGMIEVRGPNVFKGYWNMPEKTAEELRSNGYFITGDLGSVDSDGYLHIVGREKDLIISGGYNIYPKEVEDVLNDVDGVLESAVFGIPDSDFGEAVTAAIVLETNANIGRAELSKAALAKLAKFKHPKSYIFLTELPRNTMGKVQKNLLRKQHSGGA